MALYLGSKKVAGNTTSESLDDDVKDYKVTFDDSGEVEGITNIDTFMSSFKSKLTLANLFGIIKAGFKIIKDNIANLTTSNIKSTDTEGLLGKKNAQVISQDLIDEIANKVVNEFVTNQSLTNTLANYVNKNMISTSIENETEKVAATSLINQLNNDLSNVSNGLNWKIAGSATGSEELLFPESYSEICLTAYMNGQVILFATLARGLIQDAPTNYISGGSFLDHKYGMRIKLSKTSAKIEQANIDDIDQINLSGMSAYYR